MPFPPRKTPSLTAPRARVSRARKYAADLQAEIAPGTRPDLYQAFVVPENQPDTYTLNARLSPDLGVRWGLVVSDALHNLRSALDETFCQLIRLTTPKDNCRNRQFPIECKQDKIDEKLRQVPSAAVSIIKQLQPYQAGSEDLARRTPLRVLHDLNVWDKHRFLSIIMRNMCFPFDGITADGQPISGQATLSIDGYTRDIIEEAEGWTLYRCSFPALVGVTMGMPYMQLVWGWHWSGNPLFVDQTLITLADEVERVLNLLQPVFDAEVGRISAELDALGNPEVTINEYIASLETPLV